MLRKKIYFLLNMTSVQSMAIKFRGEVRQNRWSGDQSEQEILLKQEIVFKKDKATLHVISKRCEDSKLFQLN